MNWKKWGLKKSPWIYHVNTGSCNNCDIELVDCLAPKFDVERFGVKLVGSPRHADALMVTGAVSRKAKPRLERVYKATAKPCLVVAIGSCASSKGIFKDAYNCVGPVSDVVEKVDESSLVVNVPGCPPRPEAIVSGIVKGLEEL